jgi:hypothetical protein
MLTLLIRKKPQPPEEPTLAWPQWPEEPTPPWPQWPEEPTPPWQQWPEEPTLPGRRCLMRQTVRGAQEKRSPRCLRFLEALVPRRPGAPRRPAWRGAGPSSMPRPSLESRRSLPRRGRQRTGRRRKQEKRPRRSPAQGRWLGASIVGPPTLELRSPARQLGVSLSCLLSASYPCRVRFLVGLTREGSRGLPSISEARPAFEPAPALCARCYRGRSRSSRARRGGLCRGKFPPGTEAYPRCNTKPPSLTARPAASDSRGST